MKQIAQQFTSAIVAQAAVLPEGTKNLREQASREELATSQVKLSHQEFRHLLRGLENTASSADSGKMFQRALARFNSLTPENQDNMIALTQRAFDHAVVTDQMSERLGAFNKDPLDRNRLIVIAYANMLARLDQKQTEGVLSSLNKMISGEPDHKSASAELLNLRELLQFSVVYELGEDFSIQSKGSGVPTKRASQGAAPDYCIVATAQRSHIKEDPIGYSQVFEQLVLTGLTEVKGGFSSEKIAYQEGSLGRGRLMGRSLASATYQNTFYVAVAGQEQGGGFPHDSLAMDLRLGLPVKLMTASKEVSLKPNSMDELRTALRMGAIRSLSLSMPSGIKHSVGYLGRDNEGLIVLDDPIFIGDVAQENAKKASQLPAGAFRDKQGNLRITEEALLQNLYFLNKSSKDPADMTIPAQLKRGR